jgi:Tfp pilus assembly protein PilF
MRRLLLMLVMLAAGLGRIPALAQCPATNSFNVAVAHFEAENYETALEIVDCLIELNPEVGAYYNLRGSVYYQLTEYQQARQDFEQVVRLNDMACPCGLSNLGYLYETIGDYEEALQYYQRALDAASDGRAAYYLRVAQAYIGMGDLDEALATYDRALQEDPAYSAIYLGRAFFWQETGDAQRAAEEMMRYVTAEQTSNGRGVLRLDRPRNIMWTPGARLTSLFEGEQGQTFIAYAEAREDDFRVDPLLVLLTPDGTPYLANNNVARYAQRRSELAALIEVVLPESGTYELVIFHGSAYPEANGTIRLTAWVIDEADALSVGDSATITAGSVPLNVRTQPNLDSEILDALVTGTSVTLLEGPRYADGYRWWRLEADDITGWSAEMIDQVRQITRDR